MSAFWYKILYTPLTNVVVRKWFARNAKGSHISGMYMKRNALMGTNLMKRHMSNMLTDEDIHILKIPMPTIMESTGGKVTKWLKKEGESLLPGTSICRCKFSTYRNRD